MEVGERRGTSRDRTRQAEEEVETLGDTLAKVLADTHGEKLKKVELQILETQWPMCKAEALVEPLANKLTEVQTQTSLETLVEVKAKALVVENEEALGNKLTRTII